jgi:PAS domain S-box-containing protein
MTTTGGRTACVSVTTSTVLSRSGAVILSIRDVTAQRMLESELQQTKDFLEKLIDSTVDAIIACDMRGQVILFNAGAERIYGYDAESVVNRLNVQNLYPAGVASEVLRMLRSPEHGGVGKLEQTRREILTKDAELVPVNMTASIIYEDDVEVATVGIFTDLRERIRMEQRLLSAQSLLREQEKQAAIAQLAGAAAHELNQPLTSILASGQLLEREIDPEHPANRRISVILGETERMAEMVKKIGRITRFETVQYIGSTDILDLEASAQPTEPPPPERPRRPSPPPPPGPDGENIDHEEEVTAIRRHPPDKTTTIKLRIGSDGLPES